MIQQQADTKAWHAARQGRFTASVIGKLMQGPRMTKALQERIDAGEVLFGDGAMTLIAQKAAERVSGVEEFSAATYAMKRGTVLEHGARYLLGRYWQHIDKATWAPFGANTGATPDGRLADGSPVDIKCPDGITDVLRFGVEVPDGDFHALEAWNKGYAWQVMHQAYCDGAKSAWLVYFTDRLPWIKLTEEERDAVQCIIDEQCAEFNQENLFPFEYTFGSPGFAFVARRFDLTQERADLIDRTLAAAEVACENLACSFRSVLAGLDKMTNEITNAQ